MATPDKAPRKTAVQASYNVAQGTVSPGANTYQAARKTVSTTDGDAYNKQRSSAKVDLNPSNVAVNKDTSPRP